MCWNINTFLIKFTCIWHALADKGAPWHRVQQGESGARHRCLRPPLSRTSRAVAGQPTAGHFLFLLLSASSVQICDSRQLPYNISQTSERLHHLSSSFATWQTASTETFSKSEIVTAPHTHTTFEPLHDKSCYYFEIFYLYKLFGQFNVLRNLRTSWKQLSLPVKSDYFY